MRLFKEIIFLLLFIIPFSCKTRFEKQGWHRILIVSQVDTSIIKKDKEIVVKKIRDKSSYYFWLYIFKKDSIGKIISGEWGTGFRPNSDIAYYKWESDSVCLVKLLNQGNVRTSVKLLFNDPRRGMEILDESKK